MTCFQILVLVDMSCCLDLVPSFSGSNIAVVRFDLVAFVPAAAVVVEVFAKAFDSLVPWAVEAVAVVERVVELVGTFVQELIAGDVRAVFVEVVVLEAVDWVETLGAAEGCCCLESGVAFREVVVPIVDEAEASSFAEAV